MKRQEFVADPKVLTRFLSVYELRSFSRSAEACHVTQQAISKAVAGLEKSLGVTLFERGAHGATPTLFADVLARRARLILSEARLIAEEIAALRGLKAGDLRVGFGQTVALRHGAEILKRFSEQHPDIKLQIDVELSGALFKGLAAGDYDIVITAPAPSLPVDQSLAITQLYNDFDCIYVRREHPLTRVERPKLSDLCDARWIVGRKIPGRWETIVDVFAKHDLPSPKEPLNVNSLEFAVSLATSEDLILLLPTGALFREEQTGALSRIEIPELAFEHQAIIAVPRYSYMLPAASAFKRFVEDLLGTREEKRELSHSSRPG